MLFLWSMLLLSTTISTVLCVHRSHTSNKCPNGWDPAPHNSHCYFLVDRPMPQNLAQKYCSLLSPHSSLARVKNQEQNNFLQEYASERIWLQAKAKFDIIDSRASLHSPGLVLRWKDGNPVSFSNWMEGNGFEHMSYKQLCVLLDRHGKWLNAECSNSESFVCEMKRVDSDSTIFDDFPFKCPSNWTFNPKTSACYRALSEENWSWLDADKICGEEGARHGERPVLLASVHSPAENQFIMRLAEKAFPGYEYVMLGAIGHSANANQWDWIDGTSFSVYSNWQSNRPSGSRKAAVLFMRSNGLWINSYADKKYRRGDALAVCKFLVG